MLAAVVLVNTPQLQNRRQKNVCTNLCGFLDSAGWPCRGHGYPSAVGSPPAVVPTRPPPKSMDLPPVSPSTS
jgi:hypothetical protein